MENQEKLWKPQESDKAFLDKTVNYTEKFEVFLKYDDSLGGTYMGTFPTLDAAIERLEEFHGGYIVKVAKDVIHKKATKEAAPPATSRALPDAAGGEVNKIVCNPLSDSPTCSIERL